MMKMAFKNPIWRYLGWGAIATIFGSIVLVLYCVSLFHELETMMTQEQKSHPSVIYSDLYVLKKGAAFENIFLKERLTDLKLAFNESKVEETTIVQWQNRGFQYPEAILPKESPLKAEADKKITVKVKEGKIDAIQVEDKDVEELALDPTPVAQLAGSNREIRNYVKLESIPSRLLQAIIAIEDQRFLDHPGFDVRSLARALYVNLRSGASRQGGSTLTQQLVKNMTGAHQKTLFRKLRELVIAVLMEARYSKDVILERYLNEVYFGQIGSLEVHGVAEAAKYFFNKPLEKLTLSEVALMAGVVRGPYVYSPYKFLKRSLDRRNTVLHKMLELGIITDPEMKEALAQNLTFVPLSSLFGNKAPYFVDFVKYQVLEQLKEKVSAEDLSGAGLKIFTTLDMPLQRRADQAVASTVKDLEARYKIAAPLRLEGLLVSADPKTGFVKTIVGGRSYGETTFNRVLNMKRQVGSAFKPIAYLSAFLKGSDSKGVPFSGAYMVDDEPWTYTYGNQSWSPRNYEKGYRGKITLREAFANSINIPMAKIATDVGIDRIVENAHKLGIQENLPAVPSLSLGAIELKPLELLQVYTTFANRGTRVELTTVRAVLDEYDATIAHHEPRISKEFETLHIDYLNDFLRTVVLEGTAKIMPQLGYNKPAYGKTGTTSYSRDAWFAGFSQGLVGVTWTGFDELKIPETDDEDSIKAFKSPANLTGAGSALPTWTKFFAAVKPSPIIENPLESDSSFEKTRIDRTTGLKAKPSCPAELVYEEIFLPNSMPMADCNVH